MCAPVTAIASSHDLAIDTADIVTTRSPRAILRERISAMVDAPSDYTAADAATLVIEIAEHLGIRTDGLMRAIGTGDDSLAGPIGRRCRKLLAKTARLGFPGSTLLALVYFPRVESEMSVRPAEAIDRDERDRVAVRVDRADAMTEWQIDLQAEAEGAAIEQQRRRGNYAEATQEELGPDAAVKVASRSRSTLMPMRVTIAKYAALAAAASRLPDDALYFAPAWKVDRALRSIVKLRPSTRAARREIRERNAARKIAVSADRLLAAARVHALAKKSQN